MTNSASEHTSENVKLALYERLPLWASELIASNRYEQPEDPYREAFALEPDNQAMHAKWHQWGIVSHMVMAGEAFDTIVPRLLTERMDTKLAANQLNLEQEYIEDTSKWDLVAIAVATHDYGKFTKRQYTATSEGPRFDFGEHEAESGAIIRAWRERFTQLGLTERQIEYVARCAELHFELGKLRAAAKQSGTGYTIAYTTTGAFKNTVHTIAESFPDFRREIGVIFLADSLAKTDVHAGLTAFTDEDNEALHGPIEEVIAIRGLSQTLMPAAKQIAINMAVGIEYLKSVTS